MPDFAHFPLLGNLAHMCPDDFDGANQATYQITFCTVVKWADSYQNVFSDLTAWRANQLLDPIQAPMKRQV